MLWMNNLEEIIVLQNAFIIYIYIIDLMFSGIRLVILSKILHLK